MAKLIFETVHGSHLYGLAHENSDRDMFYVTDSHRVKSRHSFNEALGFDQVRVGLSTFLRRVTEGSHQSVEALFSPCKVWYRPEFTDMIESYRVTGSQVFAKYERTIRSFCFGDFKMRRHAVRLAMNLDDLREKGRFNPQMSTREVEVATELALEYVGDELHLLLVTGAHDG